jgi:sugar phosphate isomerase/epimerase
MIRLAPDATEVLRLFIIMNPLPMTPGDSTRRQFLSQLAIAGAALPLATQIAGTARAAEAQPATSATKAKSTIHVFSKPLQWLSYDATAQLLAETGYGGIDYTVRPGGHVLPEKAAEDLPRAVEAAQKAGLKVEMITTAIVSARDPQTEPLLRAAAKAGVKFYRFGNLNYDPKLGVMESLQRHKAAFKELAQLNQTLGLHGAYQNHSGTRVGSPVWDLYELFRDLDPRWVGVQYDIRHATTEGGQSWPLALRLVQPWIKCTDVKDFKWEQTRGKAAIEGTPLGEGIVPLDAYYKLFAELGLGGPISIHLEYPPFERGPNFASDAEKRAAFVTALHKDAAVLKGLLAKHKIG